MWAIAQIWKVKGWKWSAGMVGVPDLEKTLLGCSLILTDNVYRV